MISMQRTLGQPVMVPPGNMARMRSTLSRDGCRWPRTLLTMWMTCE